MVASLAPVSAGETEADLERPRERGLPRQIWRGPVSVAYRGTLSVPSPLPKQTGGVQKSSGEWGRRMEQCWCSQSSGGSK